MILSRLVAHLKQQHWTGVLIELVIVVLGVFIGLQANNWNEARAERERLRVLAEAMRADLRDSDSVQGRFSRQAADGLAAFEAARARGEKPAPYFLRIPGSDTPPRYTLEAAMQAGLAELVDPNLMFDVGFYYSEREGIGAKYVRYAEFVEREILPRLDDPASFYDESGKLKPEFEQNLQRLREWLGYGTDLIGSSQCLQRRLSTPKLKGESCRPSYGGTVGRNGTP